MKYRRDRQDRLTRLGPSVGRRTGRRPSQGRARSRRSNLGGRSASIIFDDASVDPGDRGDHPQALPARARSLAMARTVRAVKGILEERSSPNRSDASASLRAGDPMDANTDISCDDPSRSLEKTRGVPRRGRERGGLCVGGAGAGGRGGRGAERRCLAAPIERRAGTAGQWGTGARRSASSPTCSRATASRAVKEIFGPVLAVMNFRTPEEAIVRARQPPPWPRRRCVDRQRGSDLRGRAQNSGRAWWVHLQPSDAASPFGGFKGERLRTRPGRHQRGLPFVELNLTLPAENILRRENHPAAQCETGSTRCSNHPPTRDP